MIGYIYEIENLVNHKKYIGQTTNYINRKKRHLTDLRCGRHDNQHLQRAFNLYGEDNFQFHILYAINECTQQELDELEIKYISKYNTYQEGYNCNKGGQGKREETSRFSQQDVFEIKSVILYQPTYGTVLAETFNTSNTTIYRIKHNKQCANFGVLFDALPKEKQEQIYFKTLEKYDLVAKKQTKLTHSINRRQFSKQQIYWVYIYQEFNAGKRCYVGADIGVNSCNTLRCIRNHTTYFAFWYSYQQLTLEEKLEELCHYIEIYKRKPPEMLKQLLTEPISSRAKNLILKAQRLFKESTAKQLEAGDSCNEDDIV